MESRPEGINPDFICGEEVIRDSFDSDEEYQQAVALWPVCPQCGERRFVVCPVCGAAGNLFPLADAEYWDDTVVAQGNTTVNTPASLSANNAHHCGCGGHGHCADHNNCADRPNQEPHHCHCHDSDVAEADSPRDMLRWTSAIDQNISFSVTNPALMPDQTPPLPGTPNSKGNLRLISCAVCDEPFVPKFFPRCVCGYQFEMQDQQAENEEEPTIDEETIAHYRAAVHEPTFNRRTVSACVVMALIFLVGIGYLLWLFR